jgi:opacity protein-like surface antigen
MKKLLLAVSTALLASTSTAIAADMDRELGLIVSGVVDQWAGVQFIDEDTVTSDAFFANGGEGLLSLPLGTNLSIQSDIKYEYNETALDAPNFADPWGPRYSFQGAAHLSWRDPSQGLLGLFGGAGVADFNPGGRYDISFFGGEAQAYLDNITLYAQGGYVDFDARSGFTSLDDGFFARGVLRWFTTYNSRLQLEGTYADLEHLNGENSDVISGKVRYDFNVNLPIAGSTPLYVAYRGTHRNNCTFNGGDDVTDHTFMIGTSYSFAGDRLTVDRQGATLDTPDLGVMAACSLFD